MKQAPISIIITTYNDSEYLPQAIESVLTQSLLPAQLIIVDDGSLSYMPKVIANRYSKNHPNIPIEFIRKENGGASSARNLGMKHVSQPYLTFLDADDKLQKDSLLLRYKQLESLGPEYFAVYGDAITSKNSKMQFIDFDGNPATSKVGKINSGIPGGCYFYLFRTEEVKQIGMFDESLTHNEDFDFIIRLIKTGLYCKGSVGCINKLTLRPNSLSRNTNYERTFRGMMSFLEKAEKLNYFDKKELKRRKKYAHLFLAKRVIKNRPLFAMKHLLLASKL